MISLNSYWETEVQPALNTFFAGFSGMVSIGGGYNYYGAGLHYRWENAKDDVNDNFAKIALDYSVIGLRTITDDDFGEFVTDVNYNINLINTLAVIAPAVVWEDDYAKITITDQTGGSAQHEIWEDVDGEGYVLVETLAAGTLIYNNYTYQNASVDIKIRAKIGINVSGYSSAVNIVTPFVFEVDQSVLTTFTFNNLTSSFANKKITIDWGDGDVLVDYLLPTGSGLFPVSHDYAATGIYFVKITGQVDDIFKLEIYSNSLISQTKIEKWRLPRTGVFTHLYSNGFNRDVTDIFLPDDMYGLHLGNNNLSGDWTALRLTNKYRLWDFHVEENGNLTGDLTDIDWPSELAHFLIRGNKFTMNLTGKQLVQNPVYGSVIYDFSENDNIYGDVSVWLFPNRLHILRARGCKLTGDLSAAQIGDFPADIYIDFTDNKGISKMPRGKFEWVRQFLFTGNYCDAAEIDAFLVYLDNYFTGATVPLTNGSYGFSGTGMGIPTATGLAAKSSIEAKYTAAGKTISIAVNS